MGTKSLLALDSLLPRSEGQRSTGMPEVLILSGLDLVDLRVDPGPEGQPGSTTGSTRNSAPPFERTAWPGAGAMEAVVPDSRRPLCGQPSEPSNDKRHNGPKY